MKVLLILLVVAIVSIGISAHATQGRYDIVIENSESILKWIFLIDHETGTTWLYRPAGGNDEPGWHKVIFWGGSNEKGKLCSFEPEGEIFTLPKKK